MGVIVSVICMYCLFALVRPDFPETELLEDSHDIGYIQIPSYYLTLNQEVCLTQCSDFTFLAAVAIYIACVYWECFSLSCNFGAVAIM